MAPQALLVSCLLAASLSLVQAQGKEIPPKHQEELPEGSKNNYLDCCEATRDVRIAAKMANRFQSYLIQDPRMGCPLPAIVLITKAGRELCYPPDSPSALAIKNALDARKARKSRRS